MTTQNSERSAESSGAIGTSDAVESDRDLAPEPDESSEAHSTTSAETEPPSGEDGQRAVPPEAAMDFQARWGAIQQAFVDDPRSAVSDADGLVGDLLQKLSNRFEEQHRELETQWNDGEPDTEDLRAAFQRYRDFFDRLLTI